MKDIAGQELNIGDKVVFMQVGKYKRLSIGIIDRFTPKMIVVRYDDEDDELEDKIVPSVGCYKI